MSNNSDSGNGHSEPKDSVSRWLPWVHPWIRDNFRNLLTILLSVISVFVAAWLIELLSKSGLTWKAWVVVSFALFIMLALSFLWNLLIQGLKAERVTEEAKQRAQTTVAELKRLLDPLNTEGPLSDFFRRAQLLSKPTEAESPLASIFKDPGGSLPSTVQEAREHVGKAAALLGSVGGHIGEFKQWGDSWRDKANEALEALKVAYFKKRGLLMEPAEYVGLLDRARQIWKKPQAQVNLCGTMVGFSFLLPAALEKHACKLGAQFHRFNLLAVDLERDGRQQFWYSTYLAADTVRRLCQCENVLKAINDGHTILVEVRYVDHDLLVAVIEVPKTSITVLQSLDSASFLDILNGVGASPAQVRPQLGFRFDDIEGERDEYDRYSAALQNLWASFANRAEFWVLHAFDDGSILKLWNPRWTAKLEAPEKVMDKPSSGSNGFCNDDDWRKLPVCAARNEAGFLAAAATASLSIPRSQAVDFLTKLMEGVRNRYPGIQNIEKCFADKGQVLAKLREPGCDCLIRANKP